MPGMRGSRTMTSHRPWWWWTALAGTALVLVSIALSFRWVIGWTDSAFSVYVYFEHGMLCCNPTSRPPGPSAGSLPWYGTFEVYRSPIYEPWHILPVWHSAAPGLWSLKVPLHLSLLALLPVVVYPILPLVVGRNRQKRGWCVKCGYNLTGLTKPRCPECGTEVESR
jgi:hypothetical protein